MALTREEEHVEDACALFKPARIYSDFIGEKSNESEDEESDFIGFGTLFCEKVDGAVTKCNEHCTDDTIFPDENFDTGDIDRIFQSTVTENESTCIGAHAHCNRFENESRNINTGVIESDSDEYLHLFSDDDNGNVDNNNKTSSPKKRTKECGRIRQKKNRSAKRDRDPATAKVCKSTTFDHRDYWKPEVISRINALDVSILSNTESGFPEMGSNNEKESEKEDDMCCICLDSHCNPVVLHKCSHTFCKECIETQFKLKPVCPVCFTTYGIITGNQPRGNMTHALNSTRLSGYESYDTIVITYSFPNGIQSSEHPNPGVSYTGTSRVAYLPNSPEGRKVLRLLEESFKRRLTFTVGRSRTTGADNTVTWNDIHHKTSTCGGMESFGYPDPTYLSRVQEELAALGVTEESIAAGAQLNLKNV